MKRFIYSTTTSADTKVTKSARAMISDINDMSDYLSEDSYVPASANDRFIWVVDDVLYYSTLQRASKALKQAIDAGRGEELGFNGDIGQTTSICNSNNDARKLIDILMDYDAFTIVKVNPSEDYIEELVSTKLR